MAGYLIRQSSDETFDAVPSQVHPAKEKTCLLDAFFIAEIRQASGYSCLARAGGAAEPQNPRLPGFRILLDELKELIKDGLPSVWMASSTFKRIQSVVKSGDSGVCMKSIEAHYTQMNEVMVGELDNPPLVGLGRLEM